MQRAVRLTAIVSALVVAACTATTPGPSPAPSGASSIPSPSEASRAPSVSPDASEGWTELPDAPLARLEMGTAAHRGRIWLAGGLSQLGEAVSEVEVFDPASGA